MKGNCIGKAFRNTHYARNMQRRLKRLVEEQGVPEKVDDSMRKTS